MILTRDDKEITAIYRQDGSEVEEVKDANGRLVYSAAREIVGDLPLRYSGRGKPLTDYLISGNTVQDGTPTPDNPVNVVGCGVRTRNLVRNDGVSVKYRGIKYTVNADKSITVFGTAMSSVSYFIFAGNGAATNSINDYSTPIFKAGEILVFSSNSQMKIRARYTDGTYSGAEFKMDGPITLAKDIGLLYIQANSGDSINTTVFPMVNTGSTALPYEPYGYKLPLTVNATEHPIYLGQTQSTCIISKIIITGSETNIVMPHTSSFQFQGMSNITMSTDFYCTHYANIGWRSIETVTGAAFRPPNGDRFRICDLRFSSISEFKNYLVQQYQKGTPVTVFYVDTEARTSIRNSPLMKIGDYADTISFAQADVTIPTVSGNNILDTTSVVKPSEVYIKGKGIKPTGYGQLVDNNSVRILDKNNVRILVHGQ